MFNAILEVLRILEAKGQPTKDKPQRAGIEAHALKADGSGEWISCRLYLDKGEPRATMQRTDKSGQIISKEPASVDLHNAIFETTSGVKLQNGYSNTEPPRWYFGDERQAVSVNHGFKPDPRAGEILGRDTLFKQGINPPGHCQGI